LKVALAVAGELEFSTGLNYLMQPGKCIGTNSVHRSRKFTVILEPEEEGGFTVRVPSLPEIVTYGKDEADALAMAEDAIRLVLEDSAVRGEPLPDGEPARIREVTVTLAA
jgi:antitoxin HicB